VNTSAVVLQLVVDSYNYCVAPIGLNDRTWQLSVDCKSDTRDAIGGNRGVSDIEIVMNSPAGFGSELVVVCCDVRSTGRQRAALTVAGHAVLVNSFASEDSGCLVRSVLGERMSACRR
jgi:hypothetical protein